MEDGGIGFLEHRGLFLDFSFWQGKKQGKKLLIFHDKNYIMKKHISFQICFSFDQLDILS
jgi:hypothetical protein